jgi:hypothetical protein
VTPRLDLDRERTTGELLGTTFSLFGSHLALFTSITMLVVAPVVLLVDGVWGRRLAEGSNAHPSGGSQLVGFLLLWFVVPPLVTALHVKVVQRLAEGDVPSVGRALREAAPAFPRAAGAVALYSAGVFLGLLLLVVPGIWLATRWYFGAQVAVVDGSPAQRALDGSAELVRRSWWRVLRMLVISALVFGVLLLPLTAIAWFAQDGLLYTVTTVIDQSAVRSLGALFATLLFFDLRWRASAVRPAVAGGLEPAG